MDWKFVGISLRNERVNNSERWIGCFLEDSITAYGDSRECALANLLGEVQKVYPDAELYPHVQFENRNF